VNKGVEATLVQLLDTGILHADPHPGNLRYTTSRQIGYLLTIHQRYSENSDCDKMILT